MAQRSKIGGWVAQREREKSKFDFHRFLSLLSSAASSRAIFIYFANFLATNKFPAIAPSLFVSKDISLEERDISAAKCCFGIGISLHLKFP